MRSRRSCRSLATEVCHLVRSNRLIRLMPSTMVYITASLATSAFSSPAPRSRPESTIEADSGGASTEYTDATVAAGTTYFYAVLALSADGDGAQSGTVSATTPAAPPPAAPTGLAVARVGHSVLTLTWDHPQDERITGYGILRGSSADSLSTITADTGSASTEYADDTVAAETTYFYAVLALSPDGDGPQSSAITATTTAGPDPKKQPQRVVARQSMVTLLVPVDWSLKPTGLAVGDQFRLLFLSSTKRNASSSAIADYNTFIQTRAAAGRTDIRSYSTGFRAVGCTSAADARDNTSTTYTATDKGVAIYWLNGAKAADEYEDFYDGSWDDEANDKNESGTNGPDTSLPANYPFTGCKLDGTEAFTESSSRALGTASSLGSRVSRPNSSASGHGPLHSNDSAAATTATRPMYGLSAVFQVTAAGPNNPPTASNGTVTQREDWRYTFKATDFDYSDAENDAFDHLKITELPAQGGGVLTLNNVPITQNDLPMTIDSTRNRTGRLNYVPPADGNGTGFASFKFKVNDRRDDSTDVYTMTINVTPVNDPAYGRPYIRGVSQVGYTLTAKTFFAIGDRDGVPATFDYQWKRYADDGTTFEANIGANSPTYTLTESDRGRKVSIEVSFTDNEGTREGPLESFNLPRLPTHTVGEANFHSNMGLLGDTFIDFTADHGLPFTTGTNPSGYTVSRVLITSEDTQGDDITVQICEVDSSGNPTTACTALTAPNSFARGLLSFNAPTNPPLVVQGNLTKYMVVIKSPGGDSVRIDATWGDGFDYAARDSGWSMINRNQIKTSNAWRDVSGKRIRVAILGTINPSAG